MSRDVKDRFDRETTDHHLAVLHDDGLYRHLRCQRADTGTYYFDVVTWPGYLAVVGDCGDFVFSRIRDMFAFFALDGGQINPHYWSEKLQAPRPAGAETYEPDKYRQHVREWQQDTEKWDFPIATVERAGPGSARDVLTYLDEIDYGWSERDLQRLVEFREAVHEQLLAPCLPWHDESEAHRLLREFAFETVRIHDSWEWDLRDYDWQFLWCCHAIVWAIQKYRAAVPA